MVQPGGGPYFLTVQQLNFCINDLWVIVAHQSSLYKLLIIFSLELILIEINITIQSVISAELHIYLGILFSKKLTNSPICHFLSLLNGVQTMVHMDAVFLIDPTHCLKVRACFLNSVFNNHKFASQDYKARFGYMKISDKLSGLQPKYLYLSSSE